MLHINAKGYLVDIFGLDANGFAMCETCGYAYRPMTCENPACPEGKPPAQAAAIRERIEAERQQRNAENERRTVRASLRARGFTAAF